MSPGKPESEEVVAVNWCVAEAVRYPAESRAVVPRATAEHSAGSTSSTHWIRLSTRRIVALPIRTPFPNIPAHVVQAQFVWTLPLY